MDESGAHLLSALQSGYNGAALEDFADIVHFEATVNGRGMMDYDLPASGPERRDQLLRRSLAYACMALKATPEESAHPIQGYVSFSEGGLSDDSLTANITFCTSRPHVPPYVGDIRSYREEALLELTRDDAKKLMFDKMP
ncbi:hypothetical protein [Streptomyces sp. HUAS ZL42]|uniref:hypothetical protein n=1 Tax=Streptomyces sp. HUAS ZL42 TaxID=3231715 RepID=UPI00345E0FF5